MEAQEIVGLSMEDLMEDLMVELTVGPLEDLQIETEDLEVVLGTLTAKVIEYATTSNVIVQEMAVALEVMEEASEVMEVALGVTIMEV